MVSNSCANLPYCDGRMLDALERRRCKPVRVRQHLFPSALQIVQDVICLVLSACHVREHTNLQGPCLCNLLVAKQRGWWAALIGCLRGARMLDTRHNRKYGLVNFGAKSV